MRNVQQFFYWPSLWRDVNKYCKSCDVCQRNTRANPRPNRMMEREVVTVPSERVCVDVVGPFPRSKKGYTYLLTCIDVASRWPEAIPVRSTTSTIVIQHLTDIFARNGFPRILVFDNGTQFVSAIFREFCERHSIKKVEADPYCP